eukprot:symbB.v1.2.005366.t1/scaffold313.1/size231106/2
MHRLNLPDPATSGGSGAALRVLLRASLLQVPRRAGRKEESLKPSHLGQLCNSFANFLQSQSSWKELESNGDDGSTDVLAGEILQLFSSTLYPAIVANASHFQPNQITLVLPALASLLGLSQKEAVTTVEVLCAKRLQKEAWSQWSPNSLATVTQSLAKVMAASDEMLPSVDATLLSLKQHVQASDVAMGEAVRMVAALGLTSHRLDQDDCERLIVKAHALPLDKVVLWLRALQHIEMREVKLWRPLVAQLKERLDAQDPDWTLPMASRVLVSLDRLGCFEDFSEEHLLFVCGKASELLAGLPPLASANPAALMLAQVLSQLLESNLEGHVDETWRAWCLERVTYAAFAMNLESWRKSASTQRFWFQHVFLLCRLAALDWPDDQRNRRGQVHRILQGAQMSDLTMTFNNQCSLLGAFSAAGFDVANWLTMTMAKSTVLKPWQAAILFPALAASSCTKTHLEEIFSEDLSLVIRSLEPRNAGTLALASCLATMQLEGHENVTDRDSSVLRSCEEVLMAAVEMESGATLSRSMMVTLQWMRFKGDLELLPLSTLRKVSKKLSVVD